MTQFSMAFASAHPTITVLVAWLIVNVAFAVLWHRVRSGDRNSEYRRDLLAWRSQTTEPARKRRATKSLSPFLRAVRINHRRLISRPLNH
jgi:hypothetical protein